MTRPIYSMAFQAGLPGSDVIPCHGLVLIVLLVRRAEGGMTSGAAMMRFSRGFMRFAGGLPVVPVALRADLGPWRIHTHTLTSGFLANLFWFSFPPRVRLEATVLLPMAPAEVGVPNLL